MTRKPNGLAGWSARFSHSAIAVVSPDEMKRLRPLSQPEPWTHQSDQQYYFFAAFFSKSGALLDDAAKRLVRVTLRAAAAFSFSMILAITA
jgi:hypothetical protein